MSTQTTYRRQLAAYALSRSTAPVTAAELADVMIELAQAEGHPKAAWRSLNAMAVVHMMRAAEKDGAVERAEPRRNSANARSEPTFMWVGGTVQMPVAPEEETAGPPPLTLTPPDPVEETPFDAMSREQLLAVAKAQNEMLEFVADFTTSMREVRIRISRQLAQAGLA
jgi:hypothetical protein